MGLGLRGFKVEQVPPMLAKESVGPSRLDGRSRFPVPKPGRFFRFLFAQTSRKTSADEKPSHSRAAAQMGQTTIQLEVTQPHPFCAGD